MLGGARRRRDRCPLRRGRRRLLGAFPPPNAGREGVRAYAEWAFAAETDQEVWFGKPVEEGDRAVVEWWATRLDDGRESTLAGCTVLRFGADGLVAESCNYWHEEDGRRAPPEGWGG